MRTNFLPQACFFQSFNKMIKRFLLISLRKSHCFSFERRSRMFCLVLKKYIKHFGTNMKIRKLSYLGMRGEFCYSTKLVLKLLPPKTSLCICTVVACLLYVGPIYTLYRDKPEHDPSLKICIADAHLNKLFQWNGKWPQWCWSQKEEDFHFSWSSVVFD